LSGAWPPGSAPALGFRLGYDTEYVRLSLNYYIPPSRHRYPIGLLPASWLTPPRSGLEPSVGIKRRAERASARRRGRAKRHFAGRAGAQRAYQREPEF
jgi:hypothetical protein